MYGPSWGSHEDWSYFEKCQADRLAWLLAHGNKVKPDSVLEVGCGEGYILSQMFGRIKVGLDVDELRLIAATVKHPECRFFRIDAGFGLPFRDNDFHLGIVAEVHEHLPKHRSEYLAQEMRRVCLHVLVTVPHYAGRFAHISDEHLWVVHPEHLGALYPGIALEHYENLFTMGVWHK